MDKKWFIQIQRFCCQTVLKFVSREIAFRGVKGRGNPKITKQSVDMLDRDLSIDELHITHGQTCIIDCLPVEFYKAFWSVLGQGLCDVLPDSLREGMLS